MEKYKAGYKKRYWFIDFNGSRDVREDVNTFSLKHISRFILGNMFPDKEKALTALENGFGK